MALLAYTDIISLAQAKIYLRIDDTQNETDAEITSMINGALKFIEKQTNHIMFAREFVYQVDSCINIYDHPIISITTPSDADDYERTDKSTYSIFDINTEATSITMQIGYAELADVPEDLIQSAYQILKVWYYEAEKQSNSTMLPMSVKEVIDSNRRFIL